MTAKEIVNQLRRLMALCTDSEYTLYDALTEEAEGWKMRLDELEEEQDDE